MPRRWQGVRPSAAPVAPVTASFVKPLRLPQAKLLSKELAATREAGTQAAEALRSAEAANAELRDRLQLGARELHDLAAVRDARCAQPPGPSRGGLPSHPWGPWVGGGRRSWRLGWRGGAPSAFPWAVLLSRIKDLEGQLHFVQLTRKKEEETFRRK